MMRWLAVLLLLGNALSWFWFSALERQHGETDFPARSAGDIGGGSATASIMLLDEVAVSGNQDNSAALPVPVAKDAPHLPGIADESLVAGAGDAQRQGGVCVILGPLATKDAALTLMADIKVRDIASDVRVKATGETVDYWVYMPPLASSAEAGLVLEDLRQKKLDSFVIASGERRNAISLGVFVNRTNAERQQESLKKLGYATRLDQVPRDTSPYWVMVSASAGSLDKSSADILPAWRNLDPKRLEKSCETVASGIQFQ